MGGSIAHPDPVARSAALGRLFGALGAALHGVAAKTPEPGTAASLQDFARLVRSLEPARAAGTAPEPAGRLAVCRFWDAALQAAIGAAGPLVAELRTLGPWLSWTQNPNYRRRPPDASFLDNYGYAVITGPADGPPALALDPRLALGVLLLGPGAHYPLHAHPAVEVYYTLTPDGQWWRDAGPWRTEPPGTAIHHAPNVRHATRAGASPLLALYLWRGDLVTHARLAGRS